MFAGSARNASTNKQLAALAARMAQKADIEVTLIDLKNFEMPIYDGDLEGDAGLPKNAKRLKQLFIEHDGIFIASREYNSSFSPLLKTHWTGFLAHTPRMNPHFGPIMARSQPLGQSLLALWVACAVLFRFA